MKMIIEVPEIGKEYYYISFWKLGRKYRNIKIDKAIVRSWEYSSTGRLFIKLSKDDVPYSEVEVSSRFIFESQWDAIEKAAELSELENKKIDKS